MSDQIVDGHSRQVWWNVDGETVVESYTITDMAHGTPLTHSEGGVASGTANANDQRFTPDLTWISC